MSAEEDAEFVRRAVGIRKAMQDDLKAMQDNLVRKKVEAMAQGLTQEQRDALLTCAAEIAGDHVRIAREAGMPLRIAILTLLTAAGMVEMQERLEQMETPQ
jgi:hypothetical protein